MDSELLEIWTDLHLGYRQTTTYDIDRQPIRKQADHHSTYGRATTQEMN